MKGKRKQKGKGLRGITSYNEILVREQPNLHKPKKKKLRRLFVWGGEK